MKLAKQILAIPFHKCFQMKISLSYILMKSWTVNCNESYIWNLLSHSGLSVLRWISHMYAFSTFLTCRVCEWNVFGPWIMFVCLYGSNFTNWEVLLFKEIKILYVHWRSFLLFCCKVEGTVTQLPNMSDKYTIHYAIMVKFCNNFTCMWLGSIQWCEPEQTAIPDHGCRRYRSFLPFRRNSLLEALSRLRRALAFPFPASLWLKWPFTWRSSVVCNRYHQSVHITTYRLSCKQCLKFWTFACNELKFY
jgi:hypothetical protein